MKTSRCFPASIPSRRRFIGAAAMAASAAPFARSADKAGTETTGGFQVGAYTRAWGQRDYLVALDGMAEAGYRYCGVSVHAPQGRMVRVIDRDSPVEQAAALGAEARQRGLAIVSLSAGSFEADKPLATAAGQLRHLIDLAVACGAPALQINDPAKAELEPAFYRAVGACCLYAAGNRVVLAIHPHGSSGAHIRRQIDAIGHPQLRLLYDPGNVGFYSEGAIDPVQDAEALDGILHGVSIKDFDLPKTVSINPGTGRVDFPRLLARLRQGGFDRGPLLVECLAPGELDAVTVAAREAREFVQRLIA